MARKFDVQMVDDLTGDVAESTVRFGHNGRWFDIDLTAANAVEMTALLTLWSERGRAVPEGPSGAGSSRSALDRARAAAIRAWGREHGMTVADKGRIANEVVEAYRQLESSGVDATHRPPGADFTNAPRPNGSNSG